MLPPAGHTVSDHDHLTAGSAEMIMIFNASARTGVSR